MPVVLFPTYDAPHYKYAYQVLILFGGLAIIAILLLQYLHNRELYVRPRQLKISCLRFPLTNTRKKKETESRESRTPPALEETAVA